MTPFLTFLRSLIWTSVFSVVAVVAAVIVALFLPDLGLLAIVLSVSAVALALLSKE